MFVMIDDSNTKYKMSTMSMERQEQLDKLDEIIVNSRKKLSTIVSSTGWSVESLSKDVENILVCPFNESHHIPTKSLVKHLQACQWKSEGYEEFDLPLSSPSLPHGAPSCIKFDEELQDNVIKKAKEENPAMIVEVYHCYTVKWTRCAGRRLIPRTSDRLIADFTREERCAMYEYAIEHTVESDIGKDIADMNKPKASGDWKKSSYLELLAQERNLKRRRAKYRGVHTNKKSQIEILREVINQQMEMLTEYITENNGDASDYVRDNLSSKDLKGDGECEKNGKMAGRNDNSMGDRKSSIVNNDREEQEIYSKRSEDQISHRRLSDNRGYDRKNYPSRNSDRRNELTEEMRNYTKGRDRSEKREREPSERKFHKSHHKSHRHRPKDHRPKKHKRSRSRERESSRSSRDSKYADRRLDSMRDSQYEDQRMKKKRKSHS